MEIETFFSRGLERLEERSESRRLDSTRRKLDDASKQLDAAFAQLKSVP